MQPHTSQPIESHHHQLPPNQQQQQFYVDPNQPPHGHAIYGHHPNDGMYPPNAMPHPGLIQDHNGQSFVDPNSSQHLGVPVEFDPVTGAPLGPQSHQQQGHIRQLQKQVPPGANGSGNPDRSAAAAALVSSIVAVDNGKGSKVYKCPKPLCTKVYKNPNGLKYHLDRGACEVDHDVMEATTGISLHTDDPNTLFNLQLQAQQALQNGQDFPNSDGNPNAQSLTAALMASDESLKIVHRPYGCKIAGCDKRYQNLNGLKYHAKTAHPGLDFKTEVYVLFPF
ncbi:hypothetical protein HDU84_004541 [Entophlyctis sp. JEL0112]|nr:hypothetical protein HDU84_004541 [Entophlyctis sp. JEL0112]